MFDIGNITFSNVYLPSGNDPIMRNMRENYSAEMIPELLINCKSEGIIGGDWNCITRDADATKNASQKMSPSLKRVIKSFSWSDSFRCLHPHSSIFSRYYENEAHGDGATRIDRQYHWGEIEVLTASGIAFSDHHGLVLKLTVPTNFSKLQSPKGSLQKIKRAKLGIFAKPQLTPRPPSKLGMPYLIFYGTGNCLRGTNKVVGTSDPLDQTARMSQVLLFLFFEGFPLNNIPSYLMLN